MKIYVKDYGWEGAYIAVAETPEQALTIMEFDVTQEHLDSLVVHEIYEGLLFHTVGE